MSNAERQAAGVIFRSRYQRIIKVDVSRELDW